VTNGSPFGKLTLRGALRVPEITAYFWAIKALSGYRWFGWNPIFAFWFAYVATRPLGASFADWMGKPQSVGGLGWGDGTVALALGSAIFCLVAYLAITRRDVQGLERGSRASETTHLSVEPAPESVD
jgi:uncharacterized membrane-anchored protein